jgi:hypothetical protein
MTTAAQLLEYVDLADSGDEEAKAKLLARAPHLPRLARRLTLLGSQVVAVGRPPIRQAPTAEEVHLKFLEFLLRLDALARVPTGTVRAIARGVNRIEGDE